MNINIPDRVVFFDGVCGLCNRFVDFLIRNDRRRRLHFAPLQGKTAAELGISNGSAEYSTVVYRTPSGIYTEASASLRILADLGGMWRLVHFLRLIPRLISNGVYRLVARRRLRWFGTLDTCRLPEPHERERFLD